MTYDDIQNAVYETLAEIASWNGKALLDLFRYYYGMGSFDEEFYDYLVRNEYIVDDDDDDDDC